MLRALEDGAYRAFGYICMGSISYDPVPNGGEGPRGPGNYASANEGVIDTVRLAVCLYADAAVRVRVHVHVHVHVMHACLR